MSAIGWVVIMGVRRNEFRGKIFGGNLKLMAPGLTKVLTAVNKNRTVKNVNILNF